MECKTFERLTSCQGIDTSRFDCGDEEINKFIKEKAILCEKENFAKTFLMVDKKTQDLMGFYTLSSSNIGLQDIPDEFRVGNLPFPVPAVLIGQFAIAKFYQGKGLSHELLADAYIKIKHHYDQDLIAFRAIRVDTTNEKAKNFWLNKGFIPFKKNSKSLFIPISYIISSFKEEDETGKET